MLRRRLGEGSDAVAGTNVLGDVAGVNRFPSCIPGSSRGHKQARSSDSS